MSSPFSTPLRLALGSPLWPLVVVSAVVMAATCFAAERAEGEAKPGDLDAAAFHFAPRPEPVRPLRPALPLARSNAREAVASAQSSTANVPGQCLAWVRAQVGVPSRYADAATAWQHAAGRHPGDRTPPRGAAVYWTGGSAGYGHVAISLGDGRVRSSDAEGYGAVGTVPIRYFDRQWHLHYAGWAPSINGYRIPGVAA